MKKQGLVNKLFKQKQKNKQINKLFNSFLKKSNIYVLNNKEIWK